MKTKVLATIALALFTLSSCNLGKAIKDITVKMKKEMQATHDYEKNVEKWGEIITTEVENPMPFSKVQINGNVNVVFTQDSVFSIKMYGNEKAVAAYKYWWAESEFVINTEEGVKFDRTQEYNAVTPDTPAITLYITAPFITDIVVYGASNIEISDGLSQDCCLNFQINGAGDIEMEHAKIGGIFTVNISGAGNIDFNDVVCDDNVITHIQGAGNIEADNLKCKDMDAEVNGAGNIELNVDCDNLKADINGAGDIKLRGQCKTLDPNHGGTQGDIDDKLLKVNG